LTIIDVSDILSGHFKTAHPWALQNRTLGLVMRPWIGYLAAPAFRWRAATLD